MAADNNGKHWWAIGIICTIVIPAIVTGVVANENRRVEDSKEMREQIRAGDEAVRVEVKSDVLRLENKIEKIDDKIDRVVEMLGRAERRAK